MADKLFVLKISLEDTDPIVWRRLKVWADLELEDFHIILQIVMGWENVHLHQFIKGNKYYQELDEESDFNEEDKTIDYEGVTIMDLLKKKGDKMIYEYDFGDSWAHKIILEEIIDDNEILLQPICLDGAMACPPEDCGGIPGYYYLLEVMNNPKHPEYNDFVEWYGEPYKPNELNTDSINVLLSGDE